jgi:hypothetical protein
MTDTPPQTDAKADEGPTLEELQAHARELKVEGRSKMDKAELAAAILASQRVPSAGAGGDGDAGAGAGAGEAPVLEPSPPDVVGRPPLASLAQERASNRNPRVIGAP